MILRRSAIPAARAKWLALLLLGVVVASGCANRRTQLERVAKDWCETIRASQVIPVYPLTEDLEPGDVFLVQSSIQAEADVYKRRGFLPLDDRRARLRDAGYEQVYADGYWRDTWGRTPHDRRDRAGSSAPADGGTLRSGADAPRVAFPSYSFEVRRGGAFGLALPIKGVPVGLAFLGSDRATGTVTIADARTYAGDLGTLYAALEAWTQRPEVGPMLAETVRQAGRPVFLRVVSRVYLAGSVTVGLQSAGTGGFGAAAGLPPDIRILNDDGSVNENYKAALDALSRAADPGMVPGARVQFVHAGRRDVVLAESFDRLLAVGYLGFDVPVYEGGVLGAPIPTYERLERLLPAPPQAVARLSSEQAKGKVAEHALEALAAKDPARAVKVMRLTIEGLQSPAEFRPAIESLAAAGDGRNAATFEPALAAFKMAANEYVSKGGASGPRYDRYFDAFAAAYDRRDEE